MKPTAKAPTRGLFADPGPASARARRWLARGLLCLLWPCVLAAADMGSDPIGPLPPALPDPLPDCLTAPPPAAALATAHPLATAAGARILAAGGNAFDAAVTVAAVLAVVEPYGSGLGGGGFWLLHQAGSGRTWMLDARERAPHAAHRDMYLDADGHFVPALALDGPLAAAIPGVPAALDHLARHYGRLPLTTTLAPAIHLARAGFPVDATYQRLATWRLAALRSAPAAAAQFLVAGEVPALGTLLRQPDLAVTLERLAAAGHDGFYRGPVATALVAGVRAGGGIWTHDDLASYRVIERDPIVGEYRGWRLISAAPPSSGGVALVQMLNMLDGFELAALDPTTRRHLLAEVMRRAYRDRARFLGDPDQVEIPLARLLHPWYAAGLARDIDLQRATPSGGRPAAPGGTDTTHFSILDAAGNQVAATLSINYPFGAGFVPPGTGVLLNDEMDDFSAQPGVPNVYGLVGGEANAIAPGKRMLSSMSPTFLESPTGLVILGTPGGSRIISMVLQAVLAAIDGGEPTAWVSAPRIHHQYLPDQLQFEPDAIGVESQQALTARGHTLEAVPRPWGDMQLVHWDRAAGRVAAASDPRGRGLALVLPGSESMSEAMSDPRPDPAPN